MTRLLVPELEARRHLIEGYAQFPDVPEDVTNLWKAPFGPPEEWSTPRASPARTCGSRAPRRPAQGRPSGIRRSAADYRTRFKDHHSRSSSAARRSPR